MKRFRFLFAALLLMLGAAQTVRAQPIVLDQGNLLVLTPGTADKIAGILFGLDNGAVMALTPTSGATTATDQPNSPSKSRYVGVLRNSHTSAVTVSLGFKNKTGATAITFLQPTSIPAGGSLQLTEAGIRVADSSGGVVTSASYSSIASTGAITSSSPTGGVGYATGAGSAVTQASSRTTGVTINAVTGAITLVSAAGSATPFSFTVTNSAVEATDVILISQKSGTDKYTTQVVTAVAAGSFVLTLANASGTTTEQPVFNFVVLKGKAS